MVFSKHVSAEEATRRIGNGWLLQYRGTGFISRAIQHTTGSVHSHSAMTQVVGNYEACLADGIDPEPPNPKTGEPEPITPERFNAPHREAIYKHIDVLELREFVGGRRRTLEWHVLKFGGAIDVFSPNAGGRWDNEWDPIRATARMRRLCDQDYGYWGVAKLALRSIPMIRRIFPVEASKAESGQEAPFCSQAVTLATMAGGIDPVPNLPSYRVTPGMLTTSMFYQYEFTIKSQ